MEFSIDGKMFVLRGAKPAGIKLINNKTFSQAVAQGAQLCFLHVNKAQNFFAVATCSLSSAELSNPSIPRVIQNIITEFTDIFSEPNQLPPCRPGFDHRIPLKDGSIPFNLRPYMYSIIQKDIVDNLVEDILNQGIIQYSNSPYASPAVLVRKKDDSWRLCVDYRRLNQQTVKDKFPIPLIEDLMDELGESTMYSKLDLRSGYHQVRMVTGEEYKTAFKTHVGHFEYLVMPFGLTNAPASFQAMMNHIFHSFLRRFVIIFFDDIHIYSPSIDAHATHLKVVFHLIRDHNLFLKKSKCSFATSRVEYLSHFILAMVCLLILQKSKQWLIGHTQQISSSLEVFLGWQAIIEGL